MILFDDVYYYFFFMMIHDVFFSYFYFLFMAGIGGKEWLNTGRSVSEHDFSA